MKDRREHIFQRIMDKVEINHKSIHNGHPCWIWTGTTSGNPKENDRNSRGHSYPRMSLNGETVAVHRVMYTHVYGYIPARKTIDHECLNRLCVQPAHLSLTSLRENIRRRDGKAPRKNSEYSTAVPDSLTASLSRYLETEMKCEEIA